VQSHETPEGRAEKPSAKRGLVHLSMAPFHHFHHVGKSSSSNLLCRSEAFAPPIAALRRFLDHHAAGVDCRTIKPLCGCCSRGLPGQQTVRTKIFGCPKWLHMAAQLAAVVLDMGKSPTNDVGRPPMPPITAQSKRLCIPIAPCVLVCSDLNLSRFSLIVPQLVRSVKEKTPLYS